MEQEKKKKKNKGKDIVTTIVVILISILFVAGLIFGFPYQVVMYSDGGTMRLTSLSYTIMIWQRTGQGWESSEKPEDPKVSIYFYPDNFKSYDELWELDH